MHLYKHIWNTLEKERRRWRHRWERKRKYTELGLSRIPTLGRLKLKIEFEASLGYIARSCLKKPNKLTKIGKKDKVCLFIYGLFEGLRL